MLTKADDFPIHQTPEPIAYAGSDRNFYDRYFFNCYDREGDTFFAAAMGFYPALNVTDASFCVLTGGVQHNLHASRILHMERMDLTVGPIRIEVVEPLQKLRILVDDPERGIKADLTFSARHPAIEEPRFTRRQGPRMLLDYTRLTQNGVYEGAVEIGGTLFEVTPDKFRGTRDRSWGIRPVGMQDPQPVAPAPTPQFYWLWSPINFDDAVLFFHTNDDAVGEPWNRKAVLIDTATGAERDMRTACMDTRFTPGTRRIADALLVMEDKAGKTLRVRMTPHRHFYMRGLGYMNAEWGHGMLHGELAVGYNEIPADADDNAFENLHIQALVKATLEEEGAAPKPGEGVLEQLLIGPHSPSGFADLLDGAPAGGGK